MLEEIVNRYREHPIALIGCRARAKDLAYDVCEYNILLLEDAGNNSLQDYSKPSLHHESKARDLGKKGWDEHPNSSDEYIYMNDGSLARIHRMSSNASIVEKVMLLDGMIILNDVNNRLSMLEADIAGASRRIKRLHARSLMVDALFYASNAIHAKDALEASFWLKSTACYYMEAHILLNGGVPMPSHILAQMRALGDINISTITDCLGLEQANRSSIARAMRALMRLLASSNYSRLVMMAIRKKLEYLASMGMYTDAYAYTCYTCRELVRDRGMKMGSIGQIPEYDMLGIAMNLSSDHVSTSRLAEELLSICRARLNAY